MSNYIFQGGVISADKEDDGVFLFYFFAIKIPGVKKLFDIAAVCQGYRNYIMRGCNVLLITPFR